MQPKASKTQRLITPGPVRDRVVARHIQGESNRRIAREEGIDRGTVRRILSTKEVAERFADFDANFLDMAPEAIRAIRGALRSKDEKIKTAAAFRFLELMYKRGMEQMAQTGEAAAPTTTENSRYRKVVEQMVDMMVKKAELYDLPLSNFEGEMGEIKKLERAEAAEESEE